MGSITDGFASAFRDWVTDGVPASGANEPDKAEIRPLGALIEAAMGSLSLGSVTVTKDTAAHLAADLAHGDASTALVYADATDANNDLWLKSGASGSGSWANTGVLHDAVAALTAAPLAEAAASAELAGHYANDDTDADVPGGSSGERGAKYWNGQASIKAVNAAASASVAAGAAIPAYAQSIKAAVGTGSLKALFDMDGPRAAKTSTVTITIASPGVVTWTAHNLNNGDIVFLTTTGALPTGYTAGVGYYVVGKATNTFQLAATSGGAAINTSGTQSGVHTASLDPTILHSWTSLDDTPLTLTNFTSIYNGPNPRAVYTAGRGLYFGAQAGLQTTSPILTKTSGDFAFLYCIDLNTVTSTVGLQSSLPGSPADGDMVLVNADRNVTSSYGADVPIVLDTSWTQADLVNGHFKWNGSASTWERSFYLFKATGPSGSRFEASVNHFGQVGFFIFDGTNQATMISKGNVLMGQSKLLVGIRKVGNVIYFMLNGKMLFGIGVSTFPNITDLNQWYFNGSGRTGNTVQPINNGLRHYLRGLVIADDLGPDAFRDLHDTMAKRFAMPTLVRPRAARGVVTMGQSWTIGTTTISDSFRTGPNNWKGTVAPNNATYAQESSSVTREAFPNVFVARDDNTPWDIAPYAVQCDSSGNVSASGATSHFMGSLGENYLAGWAKQINAHPTGAKQDWIVSGIGAGGASLAILAAQTVTPIVQQLKTVPLQVNDHYLKLLREVVYARDFAIARGQTYTVDLFIWQQGQTDATNTAYLTATGNGLYAFYDRLCTDIQAITGQTSRPIMIAPQINYSGDGVGNGCNAGTGVIDQLFLDMEDNRGTRPMYCIGPMYQITSFIHPYRAGHRWIGELFGLATARILLDGESYGSLRPYAYTYAVGGTTIDIDFRVRAGRALTLSQTNDNNIDSALTNQGFEFTDTSAGGVTIASVTATSSTRIRVTLTGGTIAAGDILRCTGAASRYSNIADGAKVNGLYPDQDWTVSFVANEPTFKNGNLNDLRQWAVAFTKTL